MPSSRSSVTVSEMVCENENVNKVEGVEEEVKGNEEVEEAIQNAQIINQILISSIAFIENNGRGEGGNGNDETKTSSYSDFSSSSEEEDDDFDNNNTEDEDLIEKFVFGTKTLCLRQETSYQNVYGSMKNKNESDDSRVYSGAPLFRHFKGLREWVMLVQLVADGLKYMKDDFSEQHFGVYNQWRRISSSDLKFISSRLEQMVPTSKGVLKVGKVELGLITHKPRGVYEDIEDISEIFSHNDVFEAEIRILLKPSNRKSFFYKKTSFQFRCHKTGEYTQDLRPMPQGDFLGSYDPVIDFDEDRVILFSPWKICDDENLPLIGAKEEEECHFHQNNNHHHHQQQQSAKCIVCVENPRETIAIPCGHLTMCRGCSRTVILGENERCIVCRQKVERYVFVLT